MAGAKVTESANSASPIGCCAFGSFVRTMVNAIGIRTKREQFHSNIIGQSVTLARDEVRARLEQMTDYFMAHGIADRAAATAKAIAQLGAVVKRQALVMGFSDTFAVIGVVLAIAAVSLLLARKPQLNTGGAGAH